MEYKAVTFPASTQMIPRIDSVSLQQGRPLFVDHSMNSDDAMESRRRWATLGEASSAPSKRLMDVAIAAFTLLFLAPLFVAVAITIKVQSPGPVFLRQKRYGHRNRRFHLYKFRTAHRHEAYWTDARHAILNDPRTTPIGRILRRTGLDGLPQLLNVLKGDMSLVGPRPHAPGMLIADMRYEHLVPYYFQRHTVRPGITGLEQICGYRGSTREVDAAILCLDLDLEYIERWSPWLDVRIILYTLRRGLPSRSST
jgi:lipopolysaccharide/colanic/teichoic acid biosynthesis glycosyltransferase